MIPVQLGMSLAEARAALEAAGVAFEETRGHHIKLTIGDLFYRVFFRVGGVYAIREERKVASFDEARPLLLELMARRGPPLMISHSKDDGYAWWWSGVWASVGQSRDGRWYVYVTSTVDPPQNPGTSAMSTDELRVLARDTRARLAITPPGEGERAVAVAAWRDVFEARIRSLETTADVVESIAPATPIHSHPGHQLAEHADWLARHDEVFDHPDDHRGAIVVASDPMLFNAPRNFGWQFDRVITRAERVLLAVGPFAYGVYRRMAIAHELYPDPGDPSGVEPPRPTLEDRIASVREAIATGKFLPSERDELVLTRLALARERARKAP